MPFLHYCDDDHDEILIEKDDDDDHDDAEDADDNLWQLAEVSVQMWYCQLSKGDICRDATRVPDQNFK